MSEKVEIKEIGAQSDILFIRIRDSLNTVVAYYLQEQLLGLIDQGFRKFLVDLEELEYLSSAGVALFSSVILKLQRQHGKIIFINISDKIYEILRLTRMINIFTVAESHEQALSDLENFLPPS
jgi:anti-anti-sigma factor